jgi:hypothetical protein
MNPSMACLSSASQNNNRFEVTYNGVVFGHDHYQKLSSFR